MIGLPSKYLFLNGSIVVLVGLLSGIPMWLPIILNKGHETIRAWRVAHSTLIMVGLMMILIGVIIPYLSLNESTAWIAVWSLIISGYAFVFALVIGACKGYRGLTPKPYGLNTFLFAGHVIGASGSLIGIAIVVYGCFKAF